MYINVQGIKDKLEIYPNKIASISKHPNKVYII